MFGADPKHRAYLAPFIGFLLLLALGEAVEHFSGGAAFWVVGEPRYWVCPLQTLVCAALVIRYWRYYEFEAPRRWIFTAAIGVLALVIWVAPQEWLGPVIRGNWIAERIFGAPAHRTEGFDPAFFGATGWPYALNLAGRLVRLAVVVPFVEEIFWRGFLLRFLINEDFTNVPVGTFSWKSFTMVTAGFCLEHSRPDWPAAILVGALFNLVAYRTRSLSSCVLVHAVTNALLGAYILQTRQWGFW